MNKNRLGESFTHEEELIAGTPKGLLLAKLENVVLLSIAYTPANFVGGTYKQTFTFAPVQGDAPRKGIFRLDNYDASTGEVTKGNEKQIDIPPYAADAVSDGASNTKEYHGIGKDKMNRILNTLQNKGYDVQGQNPWYVDLHQHGVKLRGEWRENDNILKIIITDLNWYVAYQKVWNALDPLINNI